MTLSPGHSIHITYGKPISVRQVKDMGDENLADLLTRTFRKMQINSRIKQNKKPYEY